MVAGERGERGEEGEEEGMDRVKEIKRERGLREMVRSVERVMGRVRERRWRG